MGFQTDVNKPVTNQTWEWNGSAWSLRNTDGLPYELYGAMTYDGARGLCVLHGGVNGDTSGQTWEWDGNTWTQRTTAHQPPISVRALAYDEGRRVVVGFGGGAETSETWEYDGKDWTFRTTGGPTAIFHDSLAYHAFRHSIVLHRLGYNKNPPPPVSRETWEWDGTSWTRRILQGPLLTSGIIFNPDRGEIFAVGRTGIYGDPPIMCSWRETTAPLHITQPPQSVTVFRNEEVRLQVTVESTAPPVTYQWRRNGAIIHNATFPLYIISGAQYADSAEYDVVVTDICGSLTSEPARVTVTCREDWNQDGAINSQDYFDFLVDFFAGDADYDHNGMTDEYDHRAFILLWRLGCR
jgi:hypothetical protein